MSKNEATWRMVALNFTDIGKELAIIDEAIRFIALYNTTTVLQAEVRVDMAHNAAKRLVKHFDYLKSKIREGSHE